MKVVGLIVSLFWKKALSLAYNNIKNTLMFLIKIILSLVWFLFVVFVFSFQPNFGASLHILKVEIGGDGQSTGIDYAGFCFSFAMML